MQIHLMEADFGKLRVWRPKVFLYRYAFLVVIGSFPLSEKAKKECFVEGRGASGNTKIYHKGIGGSIEGSPALTLKYCDFYMGSDN